jgi:phosphomevalonate kinase
MQNVMEDRKGVVVSAPGKVMIVGGYLVTHRPHPAYVLSASPRLLVSVEPLHKETEEGPLRVEVLSPQFASHYKFAVTLKDSSLLLKAVCPMQPNPFVEISLTYCLAVGHAILGAQLFLRLLQRGLLVRIVAHRAFYATPAPAPSTSTASTNRDEGTTRKTGLGSSAALVSALCGAVLAYMGLVHIPRKTENNDQRSDSHTEEEEEEEEEKIEEKNKNEQKSDKEFEAKGEEGSTLSRPVIGDDGSPVLGLREVHNLAQFCHFKAQGKVGSGFDVSSAVYGSHVYTRFSPAVLQSGSGTEGTEGVDGKSLLELIRGDGWDSVVSPLPLPSGLRLMLGDVNAGAKTPVMLSKVEAWRQSLQQQQQLEGSPWERLSVLNRRVIKHFGKLQALISEDETQLQKAALLPASQWESEAGSLGKRLSKLRSTFLQVRAALKAMGQAAGVDIEPDSQTELANASMDLPGVLLAGVPGAGGMDALFVITLGEKAEELVQHFWRNRGVLPLAVQEDNNGLLALTLQFFTQFSQSMAAPL